MKKILFVIHALGYGGAGKMIVYVANYMSKQGYEVCIYAQEQVGTHYPLEENVRVIQETKFFNNYYTRHFHQAIQLRKRVKEISPDLIVSFQTNQNVFAVLATSFRNIPVIVSERGDPFQYNNIIAKIKNMIINRAEGGVFQTEAAKNYFGNRLKQRGIVIPNPVTIAKLERPVYEARMNEIAFVARLDILQKRQDIMLNAFSIVSKKVSNIKLVFYGTGSDEKELKQLVEQLDLTDRVEFKGLVKNIPESIRKSKLFVLTSDFEGMPNALIEAMAVGLPCISTDCSPGGARALIENYSNGIIVERGNVEEIADAILYLLNNPSVAEEMGKEAQNIVEMLNTDKIMSRWKQYIEKIINN